MTLTILFSFGRSCLEIVQIITHLLNQGALKDPNSLGFCQTFGIETRPGLSSKKRIILKLSVSLGNVSQVEELEISQITLLL